MRLRKLKKKFSKVGSASGILIAKSLPERNTIGCALPGTTKTYQIVSKSHYDILKKHTPAPYIPPTYGQEQCTRDPLSDIPATPDEAKLVDRIHGVLLYYSRTADPTLNGLLYISLNLKNSSERTYKNAFHLIGYTKTVSYKACGMILRIQSDTSRH